MGIEFGGNICYQLNMSNVQKVSIALTKEMNAMVQQAVASGQYASASEVVRDALRDWEERQRHKAEAIAKLKALIQQGIDSGPSQFQSMDAIIAEGRRRLALERKKSA
jgi:antitoxin ParD1/3/4